MQRGESCRPAAARASTLYFVVSGLSAIDSMYAPATARSRNGCAWPAHAQPSEGAPRRYQTSLASFVRIFNHCVETAPSAAALPERLANIAAAVTRAVFANVQRGLFEEHKLLFAFLVAAGLQRASGELPDEEWAALVHALPSAVPQDVHAAPAGCVLPSACATATCLSC